MIHNVLRAGGRGYSNQVGAPAQLKRPVLLLSWVKESLRLLRWIEVASALGGPSREAVRISRLGVLGGGHRALGTTVCDGGEIGVALGLQAGSHFGDGVPSDASAIGGCTLRFILGNRSQQGIVVTFGSHHRVLGDDVPRFGAPEETFFC